MSVRTAIGKQATPELNRIHLARWQHALALTFFDLMALGDPRVNFILSSREVSIIAGGKGPRPGLEYHESDVQILEEELQAEKARVTAEAELAEAYKGAAKDEV